MNIARRIFWWLQSVTFNYFFNSFRNYPPWNLTASANKGRRKKKKTNDDLQQFNFAVFVIILRVVFNKFKAFHSIFHEQSSLYLIAFNVINYIGI